MTGGKKVDVAGIVMGTDEDLDFGDTLEDGVALADQELVAPIDLRRSLPIDAIVEASPVQTRDDFDPTTDEKDALFLESVQEEGIESPISVLLLSREPEQYRIVFGHRRAAAARLAGIETVPALVYPEGTSQKKIAKATFNENFHRKDLNPLELARQVAESKVILECRTNAALASELNMSEAMISRLFALLEADDQIKTLVEDGKVGLQAAASLQKLPEPELNSALKIMQEGASASSALATAKGSGASMNRKRKGASRTSSNKSPEQLFVERTLGEEKASAVHKSLGRRKKYKELTEIEKAFVAVSCRNHEDHAKALADYLAHAAHVRKALLVCMRSLVKMSAVGNRAKTREQLQRALGNFGLDWMLTQ